MRIIVTGGNIEVAELDLTDLASMRKCADSLTRTADGFAATDITRDGSGRLWELSAELTGRDWQEN